MLSFAESPVLPTRPRSPSHRRAMPQLNLNFTELPVPNTLVWERLDQQQKQIVIEALSRLLTKAAQPENSTEPSHD